MLCTISTLLLLIEIQRKRPIVCENMMPKTIICQTNY
jgi:hypothetical protein